MFNLQTIVDVYGDNGVVIDIDFLEAEQKYEYLVRFSDGECEWFTIKDIKVIKINKKQLTW